MIPMSPRTRQALVNNQWDLDRKGLLRMCDVSTHLGRRLVALSMCCVALEVGAAERGADGNFETRRSRHFLLLEDVAIDHYTGAQGSRRFERDVLAVLEQSWHEVSGALHLEPRGRTQVVIYDASVYDRDFARLFGFRSAGFFDGAVHVRAGVAVDQRLATTLQHEYVHAALAGMDLPAWLGEGLAEYFERSFGGRGPTAGELQVLRRLATSSYWIPIEHLAGPNFASFDQRGATLAYLQSLAFVTYLARARGESALGHLCRDLARTRLERALQRRFGLSTAELEQAVLAELRLGR